MEQGSGSGGSPHPPMWPICSAGQRVVLPFCLSRDSRMIVFGLRPNNAGKLFGENGLSLLGTRISWSVSGMQHIYRVHQDHAVLHHGVQVLAPNQIEVVIWNYLSISWTCFSLALNSQSQKWTHSWYFWADTTTCSSWWPSLLARLRQPFGGFLVSSEASSTFCCSVALSGETQTPYPGLCLSGSD